MIDAMLVEIGMLLERIEKMVQVQDLLMDRLNICNSLEGLVSITL